MSSDSLSNPTSIHDSKHIFLGRDFVGGDFRGLCFDQGNGRASSPWQG
jgi:hypothetical protein